MDFDDPIAFMHMLAEQDLRADDLDGMLRYVPVRETSGRVKTAWFSWRASGRLHRALKDRLSTASELADKDGYNLCELTLDHLDDEFDRLLRNQGALTVWTCVRNLSPVYWVSASDSHAQVRRIAEKAIERHSKWRAGDRLVPTSWSDSEARVAGRCLAIAEAYNNLLVARRRIAKGQTARVVDWSPLRMEFTDNEGLD